MRRCVRCGKPVAQRYATCPVECLPAFLEVSQYEGTTLLVQTKGVVAWTLGHLGDFYLSGTYLPPPGWGVKTLENPWEWKLGQFGELRRRGHDKAS